MHVSCNSPWVSLRAFESKIQVPSGVPAATLREGLSLEVCNITELGGRSMMLPCMFHKNWVYHLPGTEIEN